MNIIKTSPLCWSARPNVRRSHYLPEARVLEKALLTFGQIIKLLHTSDKRTAGSQSPLYIAPGVYMPLTESLRRKGLQAKVRENNFIRQV